ncbi:hypothetical protein OIE66_37720 [Nonomuraea sp. NBC_01738]|uniref:hypothetical protein n=1 Tax=Nonomuraea sp. NBC_01738 TaxID=2976003 RepID=UPI002E0F4AEA|nr:hypothetical protein OIE66_37720 [Nonomuraea sp. NBC_01738]
MRYGRPLPHPDDRDLNLFRAEAAPGDRHAGPHPVPDDPRLALAGGDVLAAALLTEPDLARSPAVVRLVVFLDSYPEDWAGSTPRAGSATW